VTLSFFEQLRQISGIATFFVNSVSVAILSYFHGTTTKNEIGKTEISLAIWDELSEIRRDDPTLGTKFRSIERIIFTTREPTNREDLNKSGISIGSSRASARSGEQPACITGAVTEANSSTATKADEVV
jgi:hypothetical protein